MILKIGCNQALKIAVIVWVWVWVIFWRALSGTFGVIWTFRNSLFLKNLARICEKCRNGEFSPESHFLHFSAPARNFHDLLRNLKYYEAYPGLVPDKLCIQMINARRMSMRREIHCSEILTWPWIHFLSLGRSYQCHDSASPG